jgi:hypothetical protein
VYIMMRFFNRATGRWFNVQAQGINALVVFYPGEEGQADSTRPATLEEVALHKMLLEALGVVGQRSGAPALRRVMTPHGERIAQLVPGELPTGWSDLGAYCG